MHPPPVQKRRQELTDQIPVGGMQLHRVKPRLPGPERGPGVGGDHFPYILLRHLPRRGAQAFQFHGRGSGRAAPPGHPTRLDARVGDLQGDPAPGVMNRRGQGREPGYAIVALDTGLQRNRAAVGGYISQPGDDQPHPTAGQARVKIDHPGLDAAPLICQPLPGGGTPEPVGYGQGTNAQRGKQRVHGHGFSPGGRLAGPDRAKTYRAGALV